MRSNIKHTVDELEIYIHLYLEEGWSYRVLSEEKGLMLSEPIFNDRVSTKIQRTRSYRT